MSARTVTIWLAVLVVLAGLGGLVWLLLPGGAPGGPGASPLAFSDVTDAAGIDFTHEDGARGERHMPETTVGGAGWIDHDGDGLYDLYLVNGNLHPDRGGPGKTRNRLYRNLGDGSFADVTEEAGVGDTGYGAGLAVGDYDNDGRSDLYVTNLGPNVLYHNEGGGRFRDVTAEAGVAGGGWSSSAAFLDYDGDGRLDLYVCRYVDYDPTRQCSNGGVPSYCSPKEFPGLPDLLYRGREDGTFEEVGARAGIAVAGPRDGKSLGVVVLDYDDDGDSDIYVACDQVRNLLFRNEGDGTFREVGLLASVAYSSAGASQAGMGVDAGDVDLDGRPDLVVTNFADETNALYVNEGGGFFHEASGELDLVALTLVPLGFGILLSDFDGDGDLDVYVANGHVLDNVAETRPGRTFPQPDQLLENDGGRRFVDVSRTAGHWFSRRTVSRAAASADFDGDGREDVAILSSGGRATLLRNVTPGGHWIGLRLEGRQSNRDGYGARVSVTARRGGETFTRVFECRSARSYAAACDPRVRAGLGAAPVSVERVEVRWPSGVVQVIHEPAIDRYHHVVETGAGQPGKPER
ncbi:MAG: CRTAC1 family protein [Planctomycetota bacterium]|nr:CRTAC1 family protein [Planctomycetota bacterium]